MLEWLTFGSQKEGVLLRSLFADCIDASNRWIPAKIEEAKAVEFLNRVLQERNPTKELLKPTLRNLALVQEKGRPEWVARSLGYKQKTLALFILWAKNRCICNAQKSRRAKPAPQTVTALNTLAGLSHREMNRALGTVLGNLDSSRTKGDALFPASTLIQILDLENPIWPFPQAVWLKPLIQEALKAAANEKEGEAFAHPYWPKCLLG